IYARGNDSECGVPPITTRARLTMLGRSDLDLGKLGRDVGRAQALENIRRLVQGLDSRRLVQALRRVIDDLPTVAGKVLQFAERIGHGVTQGDALGRALADAVGRRLRLAAQAFGDRTGIVAVQWFGRPDGVV